VDYRHPSPVCQQENDGRDLNAGARLRMKRILHVITALPTGGAETMLLRLLSAAQADCSHAVISLKGAGTIGPRIQELGVPLYSLGIRPAAPNPLRALSIRSLTRQFRPHLIQGWMYHGNLMASFAAQGLQSPVPVVWGIHQSLQGLATVKWPTAAVVRLGARLSKRAASIVYVSQTGREQHEAFGYYSATGVVIPNGIDCQVFAPDGGSRHKVRAELGLENDSILVGLIARYHPMKDHCGFLHAAALVARAHPSVRFLLIGRGVQEAPALQALVRDLHLQDRVLLLRERSDMPRVTAALDIACSASAWGEAFSLALAEAMACGVPCVVTDVGDSAFLTADSGFAVPPSNPPAMAEAIKNVIEAGPDYRRGLGSAARKRIETEFSLPKIARRYIDLYGSILSKLK
jgi:glycosyltransferase involved in cell wall biosynthesis